MMRQPSEIKIGKYTLKEILERHLHWLNKDCEGWEFMKANLHSVDLSNTDLSHIILCYADLRYANLRNANLYDTNLSHAILHNANLYNANLRNANLCNTKLYNVNLRYADLHNAELYKTNLYYADLYNSNFCETNLRYVDLRDAKNIPFIPLACPSEGAFIAWKKVEGYLIKLEIPASAKRSSGTTQKCRASKAKVLGIYTLNGVKTKLKNVVNTSPLIPKLNYIVGETIYPDSFDEDRWNECSHGIHFFINKQDAINY